MKKIIFILLIFTVPLVAQQLNHTWGTNLAGTEMSKLTYIDTTAASTNSIYIDLNDFYPGYDINPLNITQTITGASTNDSAGVDSIYVGTAAVYSNSDRQYVGTFYVYFDNQGAAPTADSLHYTIAAAPGVYNSSTKSLANVDWGSNVTLESILKINDYLSINNVYLHATLKKSFPPEVIRLQINAPATTEVGLDDSTEVSWDFVYPAMYHQEAIQKPTNR